MQENPPQIRVTVNGESRDVASGTTVAQLVELLKFPTRFLAVERNREVLPKVRHATTSIQNGDQFEIVTLVGGG